MSRIRSKRCDCCGELFNGPDLEDIASSLPVECPYCGMHDEEPHTLQDLARAVEERADNISGQLEGLWRLANER